MNVKAPVNPKVLIWARQQAGFKLEEVVEKINLKRVSKIDIEKWENGEEFPLFADLEKLAITYKRPSAMFFFNEPPEENIQKDFRGGIEEYISPKIRYLVRKAKILQINLKELLGEINPKRSEENYLLDKIDKKQNINYIIQQVRNELGISIEIQKSWKNTKIALDTWRNVLENKGIFIFKNAFREDKEEPYKKDGFCIYNEQYPIIYLNNSSSKTRQIFTIFHELAHLILGKNGISFRSQGSFENNQEEIFCNRFCRRIFSSL